MVGIIVSKKGLLQRVGKKASEAEVLEALPGIKVNPEKFDGDEITLEVQPDRPDLLSVQGVARAVKGFLGIEKGIPPLKMEKGVQRVIVDSSVAKVRPVFASAFVEGVKLDEEKFKALIQTQEKLTLTHGRRRRKVAIGIHDADAIVFPVEYKAVPRDSPIEFIPLAKNAKFTLAKVLAEHEKGLEYAFTLKDASAFPVIFDAKGDVVSFPPIINSAKTTVTTKTKNLFLDVTGTDFEACNAALAILCQDFADDGAKVYSLQTGKILTPKIEGEKITLDCDKARKLVGQDLSDKEISLCLEKQRLGVKALGKGKLEVFIPSFRTDFLHWIDLVEEIAIGYGYNKFEPRKPDVFTIGSLSGETLLENRVQDTLAGAGFVEQWTYVLTSTEKHPAGEAVKIKNPVSSDYNALRSSLRPSLLETISRNRHEPYPQKVFEVGEVVVKDFKHHLRSVTQKHAGAVSAHSQASLSEITSSMALVFKTLNKKFTLKKSDRAGFIAGRCASVWSEGKEVGFVGEVHPEVLEKLQIQVPAALFEIVL